MKFTWFNLMPWPYLPDDFREKHRSVWVDIPNTLYDPRKGHHVYHTYLDQLEYAETLGFDGIGCNEHHQNGYGLMPSPNLIAATLARRTSRAALCVIENSIAGYLSSQRQVTLLNDSVTHEGSDSVDIHGGETADVYLYLANVGPGGARICVVLDGVV